jgi:hypothetical protein
LKNLASLFGLRIVTVGGVGFLAPSDLVWIAQHSVMSSEFYLIDTVRPWSAVHLGKGDEQHKEETPWQHHEAIGWLKKSEIK